MQKWEHILVEFLWDRGHWLYNGQSEELGKRSSIGHVLAEVGMRGWELVTFVINPDKTSAIAIFKQPLEL
jgi:hypothetical protein